jgi:hypothetical protein
VPGRGPPTTITSQATRGQSDTRDPSEPVEQPFDPEAMVARFRQRAQAVRDRGLPPVEGPERQRFREQAQLDFMDFAMLGDAEATLDDGILTLRVDLRPKDDAPGQ